MRNKMYYTVDIHRKFPEGLMREWQDSWDSDPDATIFNSPSYFLAVSHSNRKGAVLATVRSGPEHLVFLPLSYTRQFGVTFMEFPGGKNLSRSALFLKNGGIKALRHLLTVLSDTHNILLAELDDSLLAAIPQTAAVVKESSECPYLPLRDGPFRFLPKRQMTKTVRRSLELGEHLTHRCYRGDMQGLDLAVKIDEVSAKKKRGMPSFRSEKDKEYYRELIRTLGGAVIVDVLFFDRDPFVFQISLVYKKTCLLDVTAYNASYRRLAPGRLLLHALLTRLRNEKYELVDFSRGTDHLKADYTPYKRRQYTVGLIQNPVARWWWATAQGAVNRLKRNKLVHRTGLWASAALSGN